MDPIMAADAMTHGVKVTGFSNSEDAKPIMGIIITVRMTYDGGAECCIMMDDHSIDHAWPSDLEVR